MLSRASSPSPASVRLGAAFTSIRKFFVVFHLVLILYFGSVKKKKACDI
jgi:hypothetical protein